MFTQFYTFWVDLVNNKEAPAIFIRFEDLIKNKKKNISECFKLIFGVDSIEGMYIEKRIDDVLSNAETAGRIYKPRSGKTNANETRYTDAQI